MGKPNLDYINYLNTIYHFKKPFDAVFVSSIDDIKLPPNDILLSNYFSRAKPDFESVVNIISDFDALNFVLEKESELSYKKLFPVFPLSVRNKFFVGELDENSLLLSAHKSDVLYLPNGNFVNYESIFEEYPVNFSIFVFGFTNKDFVSIRESSAKIFGALEEVFPTDEFNQYSSDFKELVSFPMLAHEKGHAYLLDYHPDLAANDYLADYVGARFLRDWGFDDGLYKKFHHVKSRKNTSVKPDFSSRIISLDYHPERMVSKDDLGRVDSVLSKIGVHPI